MENKVSKGEFAEIIFTGKANGEVFDSNIEEDLKQMAPQAKPEKTIIAVGEGMLVPGLDKAIVDCEIGEEKSIKVSPSEGFGARRKELVKTVPASAFGERAREIRAGMALSVDGNLVRIISVSGARVMVDFNNPLAGKDLEYKFKVVRKVEDVKEKAEALFKHLFRFVPEFSVGDKIVVKGPKQMEIIAKAGNGVFKKMLGKELDFEEVKLEKKEEKKVVDEGKKE